MQELTMKVHKMERSYSFSDVRSSVCITEAVATWQAMGYKIMFDVGYLHQIRGRTTTLLTKRITVAPPHGSFKVMSLESGNRLVVFYGSKAFVCELHSVFLPIANCLFLF
jgi:hypothetical protein